MMDDKYEVSAHPKYRILPMVTGPWDIPSWGVCLIETQVRADEIEGTQEYHLGSVCWLCIYCIKHLRPD